MDRQTRLKKHYISITSLAGGNNSELPIMVFYLLSVAVLEIRKGEPKDMKSFRRKPSTWLLTASVFCFCLSLSNLTNYKSAVFRSLTILNSGTFSSTNTADS